VSLEGWALRFYAQAPPSEDAPVSFCLIWGQDVELSAPAPELCLPDAAMLPAMMIMD